MSAMHTCPACGGQYMDPQPDGSRYFHTCPPFEREPDGVDPGVGREPEPGAEEEPTTADTEGGADE